MHLFCLTDHFLIILVSQINQIYSTFLQIAVCLPSSQNAS
jgi:hypothetical protein